jgi:hypothetical protein
MRTEAIKGMYKVGDTYYRNRKKFLFFPKTIDNERRWWEVAEWKQVWCPAGEWSCWEDVAWIDPTPEFIK